MPTVATLLQRLRRRRGSLTDYAAVVALIAVVSIGALLAVGDRSRCILADAGRAALGLDPQGCALADGGDPNIVVPPPGEEADAEDPELETLSGTLPLATLGQGYLFQFQASDPRGRQITFLVPEGLLPPGLVLTPGGTLVGVPTQADTWTFPVSVRNADGRDASGSYTLVVNAPPIWLPLSADALRLPAGLPFSVALEAIDPDGQAVSYAIAAGDLPGAVLDPATGLLTGTAPEEGVFSLILRASDPDGASATIGATFSISNAPVWVTPAGPLPGAQGETPYAFQLEARDLNQDQLVFTLLDGALPDGINLDPSGTVFGTPAAGGGDAVFTVGVSDGGAPVPRTFSIAYTQNPVWITTALPPAVRGAPYQVLLEAQDPDADPLTFRLVGGLISDLGMTLSPEGLLSSPRIPRNFPPRALTFEVSDGRGGRATVTLSLGTSAPPQWSTPEDGLSVAQLGRPYTESLNATDPEGGNVAFTLAGGEMPPGIVLSDMNGNLSGIPTAHGTFSFTVRATDPDGGTADRTFTLTVNRQPVFLTDQTLPPARAGEVYVGRIEVSDADGDAVSFESAPPGGGTFAADGTFGFPVAADRTTPFSFSVFIRDARNGFATQTFQIPVVGAPVWETTTLPRHFGNGPYAATVAATDPNGGGVSYEVVSGPAGAAMDGAVLRIAPVSFGPVRLRATNTAGLSSERDFEVGEDAAPVWISGEDLGVVALGERPAALAAVDDGPITFHVIDGTLPDGLSIASDGRFVGSAGVSGAFAFTVEIRDGVTPPVARTFTLIAAARPVIGRTSIAPIARTGQVAVDLQIQSADGPARITSAPAPETLHPSLVLTPAGVLEGEDVILAAPVSWTVEARHPIHDGLVASRTFLLASQPAAPSGGPGGETPPADLAPVFLTQQLPPARPGIPYRMEIAVADPEGAPTTLTLLVSSQEAPGLDFDGQAIFGIPTTSGTYRYDLRAADAGGNTATAELVLVVNATPRILGPDLLPMAQQGRPYGPIALVGEDAEADPISWSFTNGGGAPGLALNPQTGVLSGVPSQAGTRAVSVRASDASGATERSWTLVVNAQPVPTVAEGYLPPLVLGAPYAIVLGATDADGDAVTASVQSGALPPGLDLDPATGALAGTPLDDADTLVVVRFADPRGGFADRTYRLAGNVPPGFTTPADLGIALIGTPFSATIAATDPNPGDTVSLDLVDGTLPPGISFIAATGTVSGIAETGARAEFLFTVRAQDPQGASSERTFRIRRDALPAFAEGEAARLAGVLSGLRQNVAMTSVQIQASDPLGETLTFDLEDGALPAGTTLSSSGEISGTPTAAGPFSATVRARTAGGAAATLALNGTVAENRPPVFAGGWLPPYVPGASYMAQLQASDPDGDALSFARISGLFPPGLSLSSNGQVSGTPGSGGERTISVQVSDGRGGQATASVQMVQNTAPTWITPSGNLGMIATGEALDGTLRVEATDAEAAQGDALTYALVDGALPAGVSIDPATGVLAGTPTDGFGVFSFTLRATDRAGAATPDRIFSLTTNARPTIDVAALTGAVGNLVRNQALSIDLRAFVSDADGQTLVLSNEGTLPANMSLVNGVLAGTPTLNQTVSWTLIVSDGFLSAQATVSTRVRTNATPTLAAAVPPIAVPGRPYTFTVPGSDADGDALTYVVQSGSLPSGLTLNTATGVISGTPTDGQPSSGGIGITLVARDVFGATSAPRTYTIAVRYAPTWDTAAGDVAVIRQSQTGVAIDLVARTPDGRAITSFTGYTAQDGLTGAAQGSASTPRTFRISGNASASAITRTYTMTAVSVDGVASEPRQFRIRVNQDPNLSGSGNFDVAWNEPAPLTPLGNAFDPDGDTLVWELVSGTMPEGLSLDTATGRLTGTPTLLGETQTLQLRVQDPYNFVSPIITRTVRVLERPVWLSDVALPTLGYGQAWEAVVVAYLPNSGGANVSYSGPSSPSGLSTTNSIVANAETPVGPRAGRRILLNTPVSSGGPWTFQVTASNGALTAVRIFTLASSQPPVAQTPADMADVAGIVGTPLTPLALVAIDPEGGALTYETLDPLPTGLSLEPSTGQITGTPTSPGVVATRWRARDPQGVFSTPRTLVFSIQPAGDGCAPLVRRTPGTITYVVPAGCTRLEVLLWGAGGAGATAPYGSGRGNGGSAAFVQGIIDVVPGETLTLSVGGLGSAGGTVGRGGNAGSTWSSGSGRAAGGGATFVQRGTGPASLANLVAVAGGGGGGTAANTGSSSGANATNAGGGRNATATSGGVSGGSGTICSSPGGNGAFLAGGNGGSGINPGSCSINAVYAGGGGGGGLYGGAGGNTTNSWFNLQGGGGGSSLAPDGGTIQQPSGQTPGGADNMLRGNAGQGQILSGTTLQSRGDGLLILRAAP